MATSPDPARIVAELDVIADTIERQRERVGELALPFVGTDRDDVVATVHEAERQLLMAGRALRRALRTLRP